MAGLGRIGAVVAGLLLPVPGYAFGWQHGWWGSTAYYYYPPPVIYYYVPAGPLVGDPCAPGPAVTTSRQEPGPQWYATPSPAPPSATEPPPAPAPEVKPKSEPIPKETKGPPPVPNPGPGVTESTSFYDAYTVAAGSTMSRAADRAKISFWNLSPRDLTVTVDGQTYLINKGKRIKLELDRQFVWKAGEHKPQVERVPAQVPGLE